MTEQRQIDKAREVLKAARADLGHDLGGMSAVDLLLDQDVADTVDEARAVLEIADRPHGPNLEAQVRLAHAEALALTPRKACETGQVWMVKVSGQVTRVRITRVGHRPNFSMRSTRNVQRPWFWGTNVKTDRPIEGNRMRLRQRVA